MENACDAVLLLIVVGEVANGVEAPSRRNSTALSAATRAQFMAVALPVWTRSRMVALLPGTRPAVHRHATDVPHGVAGQAHPAPGDCTGRNVSPAGSESLTVIGPVTVAGPLLVMVTMNSGAR